MTAPEQLSAPFSNIDEIEREFTKGLFEWRKLTFVKRCEIPAYLTFIRRQRCCVPGCTKKSTVSHLLGKGRARNKASDLLALPMCMEHHEEYEDNGIVKFQITYGLNLAKLVLQYLELFIQELLNTGPPQVEIVKKTKHYTSTRKTRGPPSKKCNSRTDFSQYQPT